MGRVLIPAAAAAAASDDLKTSWPEVVGWVTLNAADQINIDRPDVFPAFYSDTTPLPTDYDSKRVIIISDSRDVVVKTPVVG